MMDADALRKSGHGTPSPSLPTPGPWTAENHPELVSANVKEIFGADSPAWFVKAGIVTICAINGPAHLRPLEYLEADARLIAAAPDLLAALTDMVAEYDALAWGKRVHETAARARAAIAKATGTVAR